MKLLELFRQTLTEANVVNTQQVKEFAKQFADKTNSAAGKQWFNKKIPNYVINNVNLLSPYSPDTTENLPDYITKAIEKGEKLYQFNPQSVNRDLITQLDHLADWFNALEKVAGSDATNDIEANNKSLSEKELQKVIKYDLPTALSVAEKWYATISSTPAQDDNDVNVVATLADGYYVVTFKSKEAMAKDGEHLQNCLRGGMYWDNIVSGSNQVYSIRKPNGEAVVGIRVDPKNKTVIEVKGKQNKPVMPMLVPYVLQFLNDLGYSGERCGDIINAGIHYSSASGKFGSVEELADDIGKGVKVFVEKNGNNIHLFTKKLGIVVNRSYEGQVTVSTSGKMPIQYISDVLNYAMEKKKIDHIGNKLVELISVDNGAENLLFYSRRPGDNKFYTESQIDHLSENDINEIKQYYVENASRLKLSQIPPKFISKEVVVSKIVNDGFYQLSDINKNLVTADVMAEVIKKMPLMNQTVPNSNNHNRRYGGGYSIKKLNLGFSTKLREFNLLGSTEVLNAFLQKVLSAGRATDDLMASYKKVLDMFEKSAWNEETMKLCIETRLIKSAKDIPEGLITEKECLDILKQHYNADDYPNFPEKYRNDENFVIASCLLSPSVLRYVEPNQITEKLFYEVTKKYPHAYSETLLKQFPPEKWSQRIWVQDVGILAPYSKCPKKFKNEDVLKSALYNDLSNTLRNFDDPLEILNKYKSELNIDKNVLKKLESNTGIMVSKGKYINVTSLKKEPISGGGQSGFVSILRGPANIKAYFFNSDGKYEGYLYTNGGKIFVPSPNLKKYESLVLEFAKDNLKDFDANELTTIGIQKLHGQFKSEHAAVEEKKKTFDSNLDYSDITIKNSTRYEVFSKQNGKKLFTYDRGSLHFDVPAKDLIPLNSSICDFLRRFSLYGSKAIDIGIAYKNSGGWGSSTPTVFVTKKLSDINGYEVWADNLRKHISVVSKDGVIAYGVERASGKIDKITYNWNLNPSDQDKEKIQKVFDKVEENFVKEAGDRKQDKTNKISDFNKAVRAAGLKKNAYQMPVPDAREEMKKLSLANLVLPWAKQQEIGKMPQLSHIKDKWNTLYKEELEKNPKDAEQIKANLSAKARHELDTAREYLEKEALAKYAEEVSDQIDNFDPWGLRNRLALLQKSKIAQIKREMGL